MRLFKIFLILITFVFMTNTFGQETTEEKSVAGALFRSLAIPGWGEYYAENYTAAKWTFGAEIAVWTSYFFLSAKSNWLEEDYKNLAVAHAGVSSKDRDKQYWIDVGGSDDIYIHNEKAAQNRDQDAIYTDTHTYYWYWENANYHADYNNLRIQSGRFDEYASIVISGAILTRLVSSVIAVRSVKRYNSKITEEEMSFNFHVKPQIDSGYHWYPAAHFKLTF